MVTNKKHIIAREDVVSEEKLFLDTHTIKKGLNPPKLKNFIKTEMSVKLQRAGVKMVQIYYNPKNGRLHCYAAAVPTKKAMYFIRHHKVLNTSPDEVIEVKKIP